MNKQIDLSGAGVFDLVQLYLIAIVKMLEADKYGAALQQIAEGTGRLWVLPNGSTVPAAQIAFEFGDDAVKFVVITRNEKRHDQTVKYAEGIDGFLEEALKVIRAGLLAGPKGKGKPANLHAV